MKEIIQVENLVKDYGHGRGVFDVSFSAVPPPFDLRRVIFYFFQWLLEGVEINKCVQSTVLIFLATVSLVACSLSLAHSLT